MGKQFEKLEQRDWRRMIDMFEGAPEFDLNNLAVGKKLEVSTENTQYTIERREDGLYISGNSRICPEPTRAKINGSKLNRESSSIKVDKIVEGGYLEFDISQKGSDAPKRYITSRIRLVEEAE